MKIKNLSDLKKSLTIAIIVPFLIGGISFFLLFFIAYKQYINYQNKLDKQTIAFTNQLYQSSLSEQLSIIANSPVFVEFIRSGAKSRQRLLVDFLTELSTINSNSITGIKIENNAKSTLFQKGISSPFFTTLNLCYLGMKMDPIYGLCTHNITLFFSKQGYIDSLKLYNKEIYTCIGHACHYQSLLHQKILGNFSVLNHSAFVIQMAVKHSPNYFIFVFLFLVAIVLCILAILTRYKIRKIIENSIATPIANLTNCLKNQTALTHINSTDIHEISYLKTQIINFQEKEHITKIGEMAANVAHDIRSPLAVMEMIMTQASLNMPPANINILREAIQGVRDIANNLLSRYRDSNHNISEVLTTNDDGNLPRSILFSSLVESIILQKKQEWQNSSIELTLQTTANIQYECLCVPPAEIKRMLSNLLNNAYEALSENGKIELLFKTSDTNLILSIQDNGAGIPPGKINDVLNGASLKHAGKGLGLLGAKLCMEKLGGKLELYSTLTQGTKILLYFPRHP